MDATPLKSIPSEDVKVSLQPQLKLLPSPSIVTNTPDSELPQLSNDSSNPARPLASRSFTDPTSPGSPSSPLAKMNNLSLRPRNTSPYPRTHLRSRSTASSLSAPPITRSHSSPVIDTFSSSPLGRPASPLHSATRRVSPLRRPLEEWPSYSSFSGIDTYQTISENSELDITPRQTTVEDASGTPHTPGSPFSAHGTFPRTRRRPSSPLAWAPFMTPTGSRLHTSTSSPALRSPSSPASAKYNEAFPSHTPYASSIASSGLSTISGGSSIPSTPTSFRSRSPSINSLETIPDSPDAEQAAVEQAEKEMKERENEKDLSAAMEKEGMGVVRGRGRVRDGRGGERKRWSVCGAERRGDLDVIWED